MGRKAMARRSRQQLSVLVLILFAATLLWGCGGGEDETTTTSLVTTTVRSGSGSAGDDLIGQSVDTTEDTPPAFTDVYGEKPIVILFYVTGGTDDVMVIENLNALTSSFRDYVFLAYDYKTPDAYGDLSALLDVGYPPELILIDREGIVKDVWNGYVDEGTLNQALVNLDRT